MFRLGKPHRGRSPMPGGPTYDAWGAPDVLAPRNYNAIRKTMLEGHPPHTEGTRPAVTLPQVLAAFEEHKPEAIILPASSAAPLGDCLRAYYTRRGETIPLLTHIALLPLSRSTGYRPKNGQVTETEMNRLRETLDGTTRACILDHYRGNGITLRVASRILTEEVGVGSVFAPDGDIRWYGGILSGDRRIVAENNFTTSPHYKFMQEIGELAA